MTLLGEVGMNGRLSVKALFVLVLLIGCSSKRDVGNVADQSGAPLTGSRSILVALWDLAAAGNQVCATARARSHSPRGGRAPAHSWALPEPLRRVSYAAPPSAT